MLSAGGCLSTRGACYPFLDAEEHLSNALSTSEFTAMLSDVESTHTRGWPYTGMTRDQQRERSHRSGSG
jgi:hypothetical protein